MTRFCFCRGLNHHNPVNRFLDVHAFAAALGVLQQKTLMDSAFRVVKNPTKRAWPRKVCL